MMRAVLLALFILALPVVAQGQTRHNLTEGEILRGHFTQERHLKGFAAPLKSEGSFTLAPGQGLIWRTEKPFAIATVITAGGLAQEVNGNQTMKMPAAKMPFLSRLYAMLGGALAGNWRSLDEDFHLTQSGDDSDWRLEMIPKHPDNLAMPFRSIAIAGRQFVDTVILTKPDDDFDKLIFSNQALSAGPPTADEAATLKAAGL